MSDTDAPGVFDAIDGTSHEVPEPTETETQEPVQAETETKTNEEATEETGQTQTPETNEAETNTETNTETQTSETETETKVEPSQKEEIDWRTTLPPPPAPYAGPKPEVNEDGSVTNMTPEQYTQYLKEEAKSEMRQEMYVQHVENRALDEAEKVLPEIKTNPEVRRMVEDIRVASVITGKQLDSYEAAKQVANMLSGVRAEGAQNAKTSITVQKAAALDSPSNQTIDEDSVADKRLSKRLKAGDPDAFIELMDDWQKAGKV